MKKLAAHHFEDLLQVCIILFFIGPTMLTSCQCILPVLDGLLPEPHKSNTLDLVFVMGCWHAYVKLRVTEHTLTYLNRSPLILGFFFVASQGKGDVHCL